MTEGESLFAELLDERGLVHGQSYWYDSEMIETGLLQDLGPLPDYYVTVGKEPLLIEIKEFVLEGPLKKGGVRSIAHSAFHRALSPPFRKAKSQLKPYAAQLNIPTLVLFYDTTGTHILPREVLEMLFGMPEFVIPHDPKTGIGGEPLFKRGGGQQMNKDTGNYISAVGVIGFDQIEYFVACANKDMSLVRPRVRILRNPYADIEAPLQCFNADKDVIYEN